MFQKNKDTKKIFLLIFSLVFIVFLFTSDGHRYTIDEYHGQQMAFRITTLEPDPRYVEGETKHNFDIPIQNPHKLGRVCSNGITCYPASIFYSITQVPFIAVNHYFHIIDDDTLVFSIDDFTIPHYNYWRNSENVDLVFMELFYGPLFTSASVAIFFLICLEHRFSRNTSIILSFLLAFSTITWAYSNTSLNVVPALFFILLGYLFFKKFQRLHQYKFLIFSSASLGFSFLIRTDVILFIIPIWIFLLISVFTKNTKKFSLPIFSIPILFSYFIFRFIPSLRFESHASEFPLGGEIVVLATFTELPISQIFTALFGLLFSPGVGLFVFCPVLITVFFSFPDFFKKNKSECILILSFFITALLYHSYIPFWHGLVAWGPRYLLTITPFLLIPLGASLEQRNKRFMFFLLVILGAFGVFFNIAYVIQDVPWFVWSQPGSHVGLFGLHVGAQTSLWINDLIIWTFQYSQLTQSILTMFEALQHDVYLLHVFGNYVYLTFFMSFISALFYLFWRVIQCDNTKITSVTLEDNS